MVAAYKKQASSIPHMKSESQVRIDPGNEVIMEDGKQVVVVKEMKKISMGRIMKFYTPQWVAWIAMFVCVFN
jgi:hypothetical protein